MRIITKFDFEMYDDVLVAIDQWLNFHGYTTTLPEPVTQK